MYWTVSVSRSCIISSTSWSFTSTSSRVKSFHSSSSSWIISWIFIFSIGRFFIVNKIKNKVDYFNRSEALNSERRTNEYWHLSVRTSQAEYQFISRNKIVCKFAEGLYKYRILIKDILTFIEDTFLKILCLVVLEIIFKKSDQDKYYCQKKLKKNIMFKWIGRTEFLVTITELRH